MEPALNGIRIAFFSQRHGLWVTLAVELMLRDLISELIKGRGTSVMLFGAAENWQRQGVLLPTGRLTH